MRTLAFDTVGGKLYGTSDGTTADAINLHQIDTTTGKATFIAPIGVSGIGGMGADALGNLYGSKEDTGQVFLIDKVTGRPTLVSTLPVMYISDLAFRPEDGVFARPPRKSAESPRCSPISPGRSSASPRTAPRIENRRRRKRRDGRLGRARIFRSPNRR